MQWCMGLGLGSRIGAAQRHHQPNSVTYRRSPGGYGLSCQTSSHIQKVWRWFDIGDSRNNVVGEGNMAGTEGEGRPEK